MRLNAPFWLNARWFYAVTRWVNPETRWIVDHYGIAERYYEDPLTYVFHNVQDFVLNPIAAVLLVCGALIAGCLLHKQRSIKKAAVGSLLYTVYNGYEWTPRGPVDLVYNWGAFWCNNYEAPTAAFWRGFYNTCPSWHPVTGVEHFVTLRYFFKKINACYRYFFPVKPPKVVEVILPTEDQITDALVHFNKYYSVLHTPAENYRIALHICNTKIDPMQAMADGIEWARLGHNWYMRFIAEHPKVSFFKPGWTYDEMMAEWRTRMNFETEAPSSDLYWGGSSRPVCTLLDLLQNIVHFAEWIFSTFCLTGR